MVVVRGRVVSQTLTLVATTTAVQAAGVAYAQPGPRRALHVAALSATALANGVAMLICYIIQDDECLRSARRLLSLSNDEWNVTPAGETSLSLYIRQSREVESHGACATESPDTSYWRAPGLESPAHLHRRQPTKDTRADIVRCVEYKDAMTNPGHFGTHIAKHSVCDLIPHVPSPSQAEFTAHVCLELGVLKSSSRETVPSMLNPPTNFAPYDKHTDISQRPCVICARSNPDISKITTLPIKSCLKKTKNEEFSSSSSLPTSDVRDELKMKSDIENVNKEWNKAYDSPETDKVLNKISNDLAFLLNRTNEDNILDAD